MKGRDKVQLRESIVKALLYSDIFNYPLTAEEIYTKLGTNHTTTTEVQIELEHLRSEGVVFQSQNFFSMQNIPGLAERRAAGNRKAEEMMPFAIKRAQLIYRFPFVKAVMISGSLSKNFMDDRSDFDYFIVTQAERLWIARASMAIFKRVFFRNSHRFFCANYFVDSEHLHIEEHNIFTATELSTLVPVCGNQYYHQLIEANKWVNDFFPNFHERTGLTENGRNSILKRFAEGVLYLAGGPLDTLLMRVAAWRWKLQFSKKYNPADFAIAFKTRKHLSKNHPGNFQKNVTVLYGQKVDNYFRQADQS